MYVSYSTQAACGPRLGLLVPIHVARRSCWRANGEGVALARGMPNAVRSTNEVTRAQHDSMRRWALFGDGCGQERSQLSV